MLTLIYTSVVSTLLATVLIVALRPLAIRLQLVDRPSGRKTMKVSPPAGRSSDIVGGHGRRYFLSAEPSWSIVFVGTMLVMRAH